VYSNTTKFVRWFSPVSSTNTTDHHDITVILLKVALNTINQNLTDTEKILTRNADGGGGVKHCAY
jgi:hypothetical protein